MYITELFEAQDPSSILVVYPGRFQPWHKGHKMVYDYLVKIYGRDNVFVATSNKVDPPRSPFTFSEKQQFMHLTGVSADRIVETRDPYRALEVVQKYNPKTARLVFAVSEKDMAEDPRFKFGYKKDGSPTYFQPMPKNVNDMQPFETHGYIMTVPTFNFTVLGKPMKSATEVRAQFAQADEATQQAIVKDLFGAYDRHVHDIMKHKLSQAITESIAVGTKLDLTKNYGNFKTLVGVVKDITPSGKLKIQIAQAEPVPGKKGAVRVGDVVTMASNYVKGTVLENFADGRNPQDKGDAKRHGVPTKASVSTLRKVAKQGGRKGQLAHWMANMKSGRAKAKNESVTGSNQQNKKFVLYLNGEPVAKFDTEQEARLQSRYITDPNTQIELKHEICTLTPIQLKENLKTWAHSEQGVAEGEVIPFARKPQPKLTWQQLPKDVLKLANDWFWADMDDSGLDAVLDPKGYGSGTRNDVQYIAAQLQQRGWTIDHNDENDPDYGPFNIILTNKSGQSLLLPKEDAERFRGWAQGTNSNLHEGSKKSIDPNFVGFMNKTMADRVDKPKVDPLANAPTWYKNAPAMNFSAMPSHKKALQFGLAALSKLDPATSQQLAIKGEAAIVSYLLKAAKQTKVRLGFVEEDLWECQDYLSDAFHDPNINSWVDVLKQNITEDVAGVGVTEGDENQYRRPSSIEAAKISQQTNAKLDPARSKFVWKRPNQIGGSFSEQDLVSKGFKKSQYNSWGGTQAMWNRLTTVGEQLDRPTPTAQQILDKHNLSVEDFIAQLRLGVKVELEHTKDAKIAYEIALDHLNERPDYYTVLARTGLEEAASGYIPTAAEKDDPRFKTALTVDVRPGTDKKNMRALRLIK